MVRRGAEEDTVRCEKGELQTSFPRMSCRGRFPTGEMCKEESGRGQDLGIAGAFPGAQLF